MPKRSATLAVLLLFALFFTTVAHAADERRAFTLDDLYRVKAVDEPVISPDGTYVVYTVATTDWSTKKKTKSLWRVDAGGTNARRMTTADARDDHPFFSPDGRALGAFLRQTTPRYESDRRRLMLLDRTTGTIRDLTPSFDDTIGEIAFSRDGTKIYFTADVKGRTPLHEVTIATGAIRVVSAAGFLNGFDVSPDGSWAAVARRRIGTPPELYRVPLVKTGDEAATRLTAHNAAVEKEVDFRPGEEISVPGADGAPVQVFIVKPHGFDPTKKYPLILNVHGGPQQQWADSYRGDWQVYPGAGYVVAFPNPHGSTGFGQAYTAAISGDWDGKVMTDIEKVADALERLPYVDKDRMGAMGWSWGGYAMMWLEGHTTRFKAIASMMGVYDLRAMHSSTEEVWFPAWDLKGAPWENRTGYAKQSPSEYVAAFRTPCLVITGERDFRVPYTQSLEFFTDLQARGVPSRLIVFEKAGHWPSAFEMGLYYAAHLDWFHRYLGGPPSPWNPEELVSGH